MMRRDYIVRHVEEFGRVLATLLMLRKRGDLPEFNTLLEEAARKYTSFDIERLEMMDDDTFLTEILLAGNIELHEKKAIAHLLYEKMQFYTLVAEEDNRARLVQRCKKLYQRLMEESGEVYDLEVHYRISELGGK